MELSERFARVPRDGVDPSAALVIREGTLRDYDALSGLHYRAGRPATVVRLLVAEAGEKVSAVLAVSMPTLNGRWRSAAGWLSGDRRADTRLLNESVRTISRVIVDPRWRGMGVATRLVREYLRAPLTERTEAVAAMGPVCPFFARAGMREWRLPPDRRGTRLLAALREAGMEAWELSGRRRVSARLEEALRRWANDSRGARGLVRSPVGALCDAAAGVGELVAYTWEEAIRRACPLTT